MKQTVTFESTAQTPIEMAMVTASETSGYSVMVQDPFFPML